MNLNAISTIATMLKMKSFQSRIRPHQEIKPELEMGCKMMGHSVRSAEITPVFDRQKINREYLNAKACCLKSKNFWKLLWLLTNQKWNMYLLQPERTSHAAFCQLVEDECTSLLG